MRTLNLQRIFDKTLLEDDFILIYQMGKAGLSNITISLEKAFIPYWNIHTFEDCEEFLIYQNTDDVNCFFDWHIRAAYKILLGHRCRILQKRDYLRIITVVQDPVEAVVTRFFEDLHIHFIEGKKTEAIHADIDQTIEFFISAFENQIRFNYFTDWFDKEIQQNFEVDILSYISSPNEDYWRIEQSGRDILLMKLEALHKLTPKLANFLEHPKFNFILNEQETNKWYTHIQQLFLQNYSFEKLFHLYQVPLYQTIYSKEEIEQFKKKWTSM